MSGVVDTNRRYIGFWGHPPRTVLDFYKNKFALEFIDLDIDYGFPDKKVVPDAYCQIITNIVNNSLALKDNLEIIIASVGEEKCNQGKFAAWILKNLGLKVIETKNENYNDSDVSLKISTSNLPLREKIDRIMKTVYLDDKRIYQQCKPTHGFWGVPPNDFRILDIFPETTHVYGWTRCVEAGRPADLDLELYVDKGIPVIFYTQAFCAKQQLAKYLAEKYDGLWVDCNGKITNSIIAKIEAFIRLN